VRHPRFIDIRCGVGKGDTPKPIDASNFFDLPVF
jgi:hypothetical protein